jgi:AbrB family looped-hinge helix DNA binding protein
METAGTYKMTRAGQVTIPRAIREEMGLGEGSQLDFYFDAGMIIARKKKTSVEIFDSLARKTEERFERGGITRRDVKKAVETARNEMRSH